MPADVHRVIYLLPKFSKHSYAVLMKTLTNSIPAHVTDVVAYRKHILSVYYHHGWKAVIDAFKIGKSTLYEWKKAYEKEGKNTRALIPKSTRPYTMRMMCTDSRIVLFIRAMRQQYGNISKYKIKLFLDAYAKEVGIVSVSTTTIGKIINRRHFFFEAKQRVKRKRRYVVSRIKHAPKEKQPGYLQMDSITLYVLNNRYYFISIIDIVTKLAWCTLTTSLSSHQAVIALDAFTRSHPYPIRVIQTDNGHEFLGEFNTYVQNKQMTHQFIYPRCPKINGVVERFNRTIQEEFINRSEELFYDIPAFNQKLVNYLTWYNTKRPHFSLKLQTPIAYYHRLINFPECR